MRNFMQMQPMQMQPMQVEDDPRMRNAAAALTRRGVGKFKSEPDEEQEEMLTTDGTINPSIMMRRKLNLTDAL